MGAIDFELALNRRLTDKFIDADPTEIILTPLVEEDRPGGAKRKKDGIPRDAQTFKVIWPGGDGITVTADGTTRRFDFILVGSYDAELSIGDHWTYLNGQHYVIEYLFPNNGYEIKGGGVSHGSAPDHG